MLCDSIPHHFIPEFLLHVSGFAQPQNPLRIKKKFFICSESAIARLKVFPFSRYCAIKTVNTTRGFFPRLFIVLIFCLGFHYATSNNCLQDLLFGLFCIFRQIHFLLQFFQTQNQDDFVNYELTKFFL